VAYNQPSGRRADDLAGKSQEQRDAGGQLMKNRTADGIDVITEGHGHHQGGTDGRRGIRVRKQKQVRVPL